jgi:hypothetical protein
LSIGIVTEVYPSNDTVKESVLPSVPILKLPSVALNAPYFVPFTRTDAPLNERPSLSRTVPETCALCAFNETLPNMQTIIR